LSQDGSRIAFGKSDEHSGRLRILSLQSGTTREVSVKGWTNLDSVGWSADGRSLFVTSYSYDGSSLLRVALNGETQFLRQGITVLERPIASPDGQYLAFGEVSSNRNVWMIENF
jgi:Tol biopolymer transport system component